MKPTVLLDVDGILADFTTAALRVVHAKTGRMYKPSDVKTWDLFDSIPEPAAKAAVYAEMKEPGGCSSIPLYPEALEGIARLSQDAEIVIVTSPWKGSDTWAGERERWLEEHFGAHISHVIHARQKERVHGDIFVDDKASHVNGWVKYWVDSGRDPACRGVLWQNNNGIEEEVDARVLRANGWSDILKLVRRE